MVYRGLACPSTPPTEVRSNSTSPKSIRIDSLPQFKATPQPAHPERYEVRTHRLQQLENHIAIPLVSTSPSIRKHHARPRPRRALLSHHVCEDGKGRNGTYIGGNRTLRPPPPPPPRPVIFTGIFFLSFLCVEQYVAQSINARVDLSRGERHEVVEVRGVGR
jgi:hypothetical protein